MKDVRIAILQRGWVFIGEYSQKGSKVTLTSARNIRRWGTQKGLGELVSGPTSKTVLDPAGTVEFHELTVIGTILCEASSWEKHLSS